MWKTQAAVKGEGNFSTGADDGDQISEFVFLFFAQRRLAELRRRAEMLCLKDCFNNTQLRISIGPFFMTGLLWKQNRISQWDVQSRKQRTHRT